ncbi:MAG TPA: acyl-ACP desaturase [Mycobacteriales bacterium]|nr:acyl-ACP desaturase [Mycobacteriales bacterium]
MTLPTALSPDLSLLVELEPVVAANVDRHLSVAKEWMPHEYVPWQLGRDFLDDPWTPEQSRLDRVTQLSFEVNLLTEDNLPSYHREIDTAFGRDGAWGTWTGQWTAEEGRHAYAMRDYLLVSRGVDPVQLERDRMAQMKAGYYVAGEKSTLSVLAYVSFQELATRIAHRNTGLATQDPVADKLLARIAADENLHMIFYRNLVSAALEIDPSATVRAIAGEVVGFQMPGTGINDFQRKALEIAKAGIYDLRIHHDEVVWPLLRHWGFFEIEGLSGEAEQARVEVTGYLEAVDAMASKFTTKREERAARVAARV